MQRSTNDKRYEHMIRSPCKIYVEIVPPKTRETTFQIFLTPFWWITKVDLSCGTQQSGWPGMYPTSIAWAQLRSSTARLAWLGTAFHVDVDMLRGCRMVMGWYAVDWWFILVVSYHISMTPVLNCTTCDMRCSQLCICTRTGFNAMPYKRGSPSTALLIAS